MVSRFPVAELGRFLALSSAGDSAAYRLQQLVLNAAPEQTVVDFSGVESVTVSFANAFLGRLLTSTLRGLVRVEGANDVVAEAIRTAVDRRRSSPTDAAV